MPTETIKQTEEAKQLCENIDREIFFHTEAQQQLLQEIIKVAEAGIKAVAKMKLHNHTIPTGGTFVEYADRIQTLCGTIHSRQQQCRALRKVKRITQLTKSEVQS